MKRFPDMESLTWLPKNVSEEREKFWEFFLDSDLLFPLKVADVSSGQWWGQGRGHRKDRENERRCPGVCLKRKQK